MYLELEARLLLFWMYDKVVGSMDRIRNTVENIEHLENYIL